MWQHPFSRQTQPQATNTQQLTPAPPDNAGANQFTGIGQKQLKVETENGALLALGEDDVQVSRSIASNGNGAAHDYFMWYAGIGLRGDTDKRYLYQYNVQYIGHCVNTFLRPFYGFLYTTNNTQIIQGTLPHQVYPWVTAVVSMNASASYRDTKGDGAYKLLSGEHPIGLIIGVQAVVYKDQNAKTYVNGQLDLSLQRIYSPDPGIIKLMI